MSGLRWITRDGERSLSIQPDRGRWDYWSAQDKADAWDGILTMHSNTSYWKNTESMEYQFMCHARYFWNVAKQPWNIEPGKRLKDINPVTCN